MLSDYVRYLKNINNSLIQCGVNLSSEIPHNYDEVFILGEKLSDLLWFYSIMELSASSSRLKGFMFPLNASYLSSLRSEYLEEYLLYRSGYSKISTSSELARRGITGSNNETQYPDDTEVYTEESADGVLEDEFEEPISNEDFDDEFLEPDSEDSFDDFDDEFLEPDSDDSIDDFDDEFVSPDAEEGDENEFITPSWGNSDDESGNTDDNEEDDFPEWGSSDDEEDGSDEDFPDWGNSDDEDEDDFPDWGSSDDEDEDTFSNWRSDSSDTGESTKTQSGNLHNSTTSQSKKLSKEKQEQLDEIEKTARVIGSLADGILSKGSILKSKMSKKLKTSLDKME